MQVGRAMGVQKADGMHASAPQCSTDARCKCVAEALGACTGMVPAPMGMQPGMMMANGMPMQPGMPMGAPGMMGMPMQPH